MSLFTTFSAGPPRSLYVLSNSVVRTGELRFGVILVNPGVFVGTGVVLSMNIVFDMLYSSVIMKLLFTVMSVSGHLVHERSVFYPLDVFIFCGQV